MGAFFGGEYSAMDPDGLAGNQQGETAGLVADGAAIAAPFLKGFGLLRVARTAVTDQPPEFLRKLLRLRCHLYYSGTRVNQVDDGDLLPLVCKITSLRLPWNPADIRLEVVQDEQPKSGLQELAVEHEVVHLSTLRLLGPERLSAFKQLPHCVPSNWHA